jgi:uncharacterized membrane protein YhaH (DUF805 family)
MNWFTRHITGIADFRTRENRQPFWLWVLLVYGTQFVISMIITIPMTASMMQQMVPVIQGDPQRLQANPGEMMALMKPFMQQMMIVGMVLAVIVFVLLAAAIVRRLHDRNMSGWWASPVFLSWLAGPILSALALPKMLDAMTAMQPGAAGTANLVAASNQFAWISVVQWLGFLLMIVLIVFLALPGTAGSNRYGDDPLGTATGDIFD